MKQVNIIDYSDNYAEDFKRISYTWMDEYFGIETEDRLLIENHKARIIETGGLILFAQIDDKIVGTCTLIKHDSQHYELAKMGVMREYQGQQIGKKLAQAILEKARQMGAQKVFLESSAKLKAALSLYHKIGFRPDADLPIIPQSRCNVQLAISL